jgi:hypothetical protein
MCQLICVHIDPSLAIIIYWASPKFSSVGAAISDAIDKILSKIEDSTMSNRKHHTALYTTFGVSVSSRMLFAKNVEPSRPNDRTDVTSAGRCQEDSRFVSILYLELHVIQFSFI